ncbi:MAG: phenylalanine--tRNA ligase subunit alpha, partial [Candidatus Mucispirillum faecigallinarum]|nr:phenylalanine--tRNA ligase subunit alpha [Candidatus Mucispirillum faecigallinarum]
MNNDELKKASEFEEEIEKSSSLDELNNIRVKYVGKKGIISLLNKVVSTLSPEERPKMGETIQNLRNNFEAKFAEKSNR